MDMGIFKAYDIRGIYPKELDEEAIYKIGKAIQKKYELESVVVTQDCRLSSPSLFNALKDAFVEEGVKVFSIGMTPTPQMYFSTKILNVDFGIAISASHNPKEYNGLKLYYRGENLSSDEIKEIGRVANSLDIEYRKGDGEKGYELISTDENYIDYVLSHLNVKDLRLRVVLDSGNGVGGPIARKILEIIKENNPGFEFDILFEGPDGEFPNHHPDPLKVENTEILRKRIKEGGYDLGVALDGDADRIVFIDENGNYVNGDITLGILALEFLDNEEYKNPRFVTEVKTSKALIDFINSKGGSIEIYKVGRTHIERKFKEIGAVLAGELSGHYFYKENGYDDALFAMIKMLNVLNLKGKSLSQLVDEFPKYYNTPELRIKVEEDRKFEIINEVVSYFKNEGYKVLDIDGARVEFDDGWGLIRASNTEPALTLRFEAKTKEGVERIKGLFGEVLKKYGVEI